jgi:sec-independent protein translocase protein TatA
MFQIASIQLLSIFQGEHMIFILLAILLLFGGKKIPELMRGLGKGVREFNDAKSNVRREIEDGISEKDRQAAAGNSTVPANPPNQA